MKLDKDTLVKHQFWLLLGLSGVLALASLVLLFLGPAAKAQAERKKFDDAKNSLGPKAPRDPKNPKFLTAWNKRRDYFTGHKNTVWKQAWLTQADIMTWPRELADLSQKYFGDEINPRERLAYAKKDGPYDSQFSFEAFFAPPAGDNVYFPISYDPKTTFGKYAWKETPSIEECWLAQEDIWVRREILHVLSEALRNSGRFKQIRDPLWRESVPAAAGGALDALVRRDPEAKVYQERTPPKGKGAVASRLFRNNNWEVDLLLEPNPARSGTLRISAHSTIKNVNSTRRPLSLVNRYTRPDGKIMVAELQLRLHQENADSTSLPTITGELLRWGDAVEFKHSFAPRTIDLTKDFDIEELFNPATSPIKLLEDIRLGKDALDNRFVAGGFEIQKGRLTPKPKENTENPEGQPNAATLGSGPPTGGSAMPPGGMSPPTGQGPMTGQPGQGAAAKDDLTPNGINRLRYVSSPEIETVRRIPVAFVVLIDQAFRNEVLSAVANSRLRIQTTQVYWAHRDYVPSKTAVPGNDQLPRMGPPGPLVGPMGNGPGGVRVPPGVGSVPPGVGSVPPGVGSVPPGVGSVPPGVGSVPPGVGGADGVPDAASAADANRNLIELTVYGVAALFERYPKKPEKPAGGDPSQANPTAPPK